MYQKLKVKGLELLGNKPEVNRDKHMCRDTVVENHWFTESRMASVPFFSLLFVLRKIWNQANEIKPMNESQCMKANEWMPMNESQWMKADEWKPMNKSQWMNANEWKPMNESINYQLISCPRKANGENIFILILVEGDS